MKKQEDFYNSRDPDYLKYIKNVPYSRHLVGIMEKSLGRKIGKVLEVGAGQGRFTFELAGCAGQIMATDISEKELSVLKEVGRKLGKANIKVKRWDVLKRPEGFISGKYDHIVGFFILHHLPRTLLSQVIANLSFLLKKGGKMSFIEPNNLYPFHLAEMLLVKDMKWEIEKGIYSNYIGLFKSACATKGLKIIISRKFGFSPPPLINLIPKSVITDHFIEKVPLCRQFLCPFILLTAQKA